MLINKLWYLIANRRYCIRFNNCDYKSYRQPKYRYCILRWLLPPRSYRCAKYFPNLEEGHSDCALRFQGWSHICCFILRSCLPLLFLFPLTWFTLSCYLPCPSLFSGLLPWTSVKIVLVSLSPCLFIVIVVVTVSAPSCSNLVMFSSLSSLREFQIVFCEMKSSLVPPLVLQPPFSHHVDHWWSEQLGNPPAGLLSFLSSSFITWNISVSIVFQRRLAPTSRELAMYAN